MDDEQQNKHTRGSQVSTQKMIESSVQSTVLVRRESAKQSPQQIKIGLIIRGTGCLVNGGSSEERQVTIQHDFVIAANIQSRLDFRHVAVVLECRFDVIHIRVPIHVISTTAKMEYSSHGNGADWSRRNSLNPSVPSTLQSPSKNNI